MVEQSMVKRQRPIDKVPTGLIEYASSTETSVSIRFEEMRKAWEWEIMMENPIPKNVWLTDKTVIGKHKHKAAKIEKKIQDLYAILSASQRKSYA